MDKIGTLVIIDTDSEFLNRFNKRLSYSKLDSKYRLLNIIPDTSLDKISMLNNIISQVGDLLKNDTNVVAIFVDIVVIENGLNIDQTGLEIADRIKTKYPNLLCYNITAKVDVREQRDIMSEASLGNNDGVFPKYFLEGEYFTEDRLEKIIKPKYRKVPATEPTINDDLHHVSSFDIAILTALHDVEFVNVLSLCDWTDTIDGNALTYHIGHMVSANGRPVKVIATHQPSTGLVDSAVIATEMITKFNPKFLIMPGVCGGKPDENTSFGDIVFATNVFLYQKGKETNEGFERELVNCNIDTKLIHKIRENKQKIIRLIQDADASRDLSRLDIHFKPMACSNLVINKKNYFEEKISNIDRNTMAVDMESYSVARACNLSGFSATKAIIIKSIMDKTSNKNDLSKPFAGYTSAQAVSHLIKTVLF